ncbi:MAG: hypothetical protein FKGGLIKP_00889 [Sodalis sp. Fse]|nr:MAG: hypothetical protein FKGGLIKP_00889 [Sodalis sp. Fse]
MKTKLNELLECPCSFTYKLMEIAQLGLVYEVIEVVQCHALGDYLPQIKSSNKENYYSISIIITGTYLEQVEILYEEQGNIDNVCMVL